MKLEHIAMMVGLALTPMSETARAAIIPSEISTVQSDSEDTLISLILTGLGNISMQIANSINNISAFNASYVLT